MQSGAGVGQRDETVADEIFALANDDADRARQWLADALTQQRREGSSSALTADQQASIRNVLSLDWWQAAVADSAEDGVIKHDELLEELLPAAVRAAAALPLGGVVLAMFLRNVVNEAWELNWDHRLIRAAVNAAVHAATALSPDGANAVAWDLLQFMNREFDVETSLLTGNLTAVVAVTAQAVSTIAPIHQAARELAAHPGRARLIAETASEHRYYQAVHDIALMTSDLLARRTAGGSAEISRITALIDEGDFRAADASELRGHLASLHTVSDAATEPWLHIDEGRVRIVYGFGVLQHGSEEFSADLEDLCTRIAASSTIGGRLGPLPITKVLRRLTLSDVWQGSDSLGRRYRGSTIQLEDLVLREQRADAGELIIHTQIQLSELGNHAVLFDIDLENAAAFEVAQIVNLATPIFGDLTEIPTALRLHPTSDARARLPRLADVVSGILDDIRLHLRQVRTDRDSEGRGPGLATDPISARYGSFGVLVTVTRASRDIAGERTPLVSAREITALWGAQPLLHPLPAGASGVADWTMSNVDDVPRFDLLHLNDEVLTANSNVTMLASFRSPQYAVGELESFITFAHTMHGMYQAWHSKIRDHAERIAGLLADVERHLAAADAASTAKDHEAQAEFADQLGELVRVIERAELELQSFVQSKHAIVLFIESPAIVSSPALRLDLDTVLASTHYEQLRGGFERAVRDVLGSRLQPLLEVCHRRIERILDDRLAERERRAERLEGVLGVVLAVIGISGMVSVIQEGFDLNGDVTWWFVVAIVLVAVIIGFAMLLLSRRPARRRRSKRQK